MILPLYDFIPYKLTLRIFHVKEKVLNLKLIGGFKIQVFIDLQ
jgi:hypothetical protein